MGLGSHGGGLETVRYLLSRGAELVVTDLKDEKALTDTLLQIDDRRIRFVLGRHEEKDFSEADIVVKNPAVPRSSSYLAAASRVETDISLFLREVQKNRPRIVAWTGSKGKSTTAAATAHVISGIGLDCRLAGNITVSPLRYVDDALAGAIMVLELSSFQLGDLAFAAKRSLVPFPSLSALVSGITNIFPDHQDYYTSMEDYVADKRLVYADQEANQWTIVGDDAYGQDFSSDTPAQPVRIFETDTDLPDHGDEVGVRASGGARSDWVNNARRDRTAYYRAISESGTLYAGGDRVFTLPSRLLVSGSHNRRNLTAAAVAAYLVGAPADKIPPAAAGFTGIPHRLEHLGQIEGVDVYNDTAATIPQATLRAVKAFDAPVHLILGGTDKTLDLSVMPQIAESVASIHLIDGSATRRMVEALGVGRAAGPFGDLEGALRSALSHARGGDVVLFSPGAASFELFHHEFHRGDEFKRVCAEIGVEPPDSMPDEKPDEK